MDGFMAKPVKQDALRLTLEQLEQLRSGGIPPEPQPGTAPSCTLSTALSRQLEVARNSALPAVLVRASCNLPCGVSVVQRVGRNLLTLVDVESVSLSLFGARGGDRKQLWPTQPVYLSQEIIWSLGLLCVDPQHSTCMGDSTLVWCRDQGESCAL